ncbi:MAG: YbhB/YbcL family Raf kinase inhibitor-like protein [Xanthobacteraceae bacterium]
MSDPSKTSIAHKRIKRRLAVLGLAALAFTLSAPAAFAFSVSFAWCQGSPDGSPNFVLNDVPHGTVNLRFAMTDLDKPGFHHGGGTVGYRGQPEVPCDAFASGFIGPTPPPGEVHTYEFSIQALAPDGTVLGATTARRRFPE